VNTYTLGSQKPIYRLVLSSQNSPTDRARELF